MALHKEIEFENDICNHLAANGWLYAPPGSDGDAKGYDPPRALFPADVVAWVQESQPDAWAAIVKAHGAHAEATLLDRLRKLMDDQGINEAVDQYKFDRTPKPKGKAFAEPLLDFPRGALVHFAVTNRTVMMTTKLQGPSTCFLPFNLGDHGAAGNPPNGQGHRTHYLWEQVWQRDSWLEIIARYLVTKRDEKKRITGVLFPRYHQLDATRKLVQATTTTSRWSAWCRWS